VAVALGSGEETRRRFGYGWLAVVLGLFIATHVVLFLVLRPPFSDALNTYLPRYAIPVIDGGGTAYKDVTIHYPPVAWWAIALPRLLDDQPVLPGEKVDSNHRGPVADHYQRVFRAEMLACDVVAMLLFLATIWQRRPELIGWLGMTYVVTTALFSPMLYDWLDAGLLLLLMAWACCWARSLQNGIHARRWRWAAYGFLGLSVAYKVVPILAVPYLLLAEWNSAARKESLRGALSAVATGAGGPFLLHMPTAGLWPFYLFLFHGVRAVHVESFWATLLMAASLLGLKLNVDFGGGAFVLISPITPLPEILSVMATLGFLIGVALWARRQGAAFDATQAYRLACLVIGAALLLSKVLSPPYFIWALPLLMLLAAEILPDSRPAMLALFLTCLAVAGMTIFVYPCHYFSDTDPWGLVPDLSPVSCTVLALRNFTYLGLVVWLGRGALRPAGSCQTVAAQPV
jgi:hypothetical protein